MSFRSIALGALLVLSVFGSDVRAQCTALNGTGCLVVRPPTCPTAPQVNTRFSVQCPSAACSTSTPFLIAGVQLPVFVTLLPPIACDRNGCIQTCTPFIVLPASSLVINIPNDAGLIGQSICVQCGCLEANPCVTLTQGLKVTVQP